MKIPANSTDSFINNPPQNIKAALIYGPDIGLVSQRFDKLKNIILNGKITNFNSRELKWDLIKEDPAQLGFEMKARALGAAKSVIQIRAEGGVFKKELAEIIENTKANNFIIFTAGDLSAGAGIRKLFEKHKELAALACYKDDQNAVRQIVGSSLRENGFNFSPQIVQMIAENFAGDRLIILSELEKLFTYMGDNKDITEDDIKNCITDSAEISLQDICNNAAGRNFVKCMKAYDKAISEGMAAITIIRAMINYFMRLNQIKKLIRTGKNEQQAMASLAPPVFFKQMPILKNHLNLWNEAAITKTLLELISLEIKCKETAMPIELICSNFLATLGYGKR